LVLHIMTAIMKAAGSRMATIMKAGVRERLTDKGIMREEWAGIEALYLKQRTWRKVATTVVKGMRDHAADFNHSALECVPASWIIRADGRPTVQDEEEDKEGQEDAVCMCCFDGTSLEGNRIMFCDGCNAAVHQACYGVQEIPDGDFFCDRCRAIQIMADEGLDDNESGPEHYFDPDRARDAIKCCLCPMYHGGLKPTTDGRWIHLCCAIWSQKASIVDLVEMSPVDVTAVPEQPYKEMRTGRNDDDRNRRRSGERGDFSFNDSKEGQSSTQVVSLYNGGKEGLEEGIADCCMYCGAYGGYLVRCAGCFPGTGTGTGACASSSSTPKSRCGAVFHPLCAWFKGVHVQAAVTDPTFQVTIYLATCHHIIKRAVFHCTALHCTAILKGFCSHGLL
jgi:PHD-finger/PHD-zinc-finger like domain